jgi:hypothetical protein
VSFFRFARTLGAIEFRYQLRQRLGLWVPQDELDWGIHYCFALCHLRNFFATAAARPKHAMTCFMSAKNNLACWRKQAITSQPGQ